jgi:hypothetical protein
MKVELHIDELILEGIPNSQREQVAAAIEQALTALVTEHGVPSAWQGGNIATLTQQVQPGCRPEVIGRQVARAMLGSKSSAPDSFQSSRTGSSQISPQPRSIS